MTSSLVRRELSNYIKSVNNLLGMTGLFTMDEKYHFITICPRHRADYGIRWRSCKVTCAVPTDIAAHKSATAKGSKALTSKDAHFILTKTGKCVEVGLRKYHLVNK